MIYNIKEIKEKQIDYLIFLKIPEELSSKILEIKYAEEEFQQKKISKDLNFDILIARHLYSMK